MTMPASPADRLALERLKAIDLIRFLHVARLDPRMGIELLRLTHVARERVMSGAAVWTEGWNSRAGQINAVRRDRVNRMAEPPRPATPDEIQLGQEITALGGDRLAECLQAGHPKAARPRGLQLRYCQTCQLYLADGQLLQLLPEVPVLLADERQMRILTSAVTTSIQIHTNPPVRLSRDNVHKGWWSLSIRFPKGWLYPARFQVEFPVNQWERICWRLQPLIDQQVQDPVQWFYEAVKGLYGVVHETTPGYLRSFL